MRRSVGISILVALAASVFLTGVASAAGPPTSPPGAPTNVKATAGTLAATVVWHAPQSGGTVSTYTVTSNPGSISATVAGPAFSAAVTGLSYGLAYTFTVVATNGAGSGLPSAPSNAVTPDPPGSQFHVTPSYVLFSNTVTAGHPASAYFGEDPVLVPGLTAVAVNVTASQSTADTSVQIVINSQPIQTISLPAGQVVSSLAIVAMPPSLFQASIQVTTGSAHVELDSVGFYTGPKLFRNHGGMFQPLPPAALFSGNVAANSTTSIPVLGQAGIPAANVQAVLLNVTAAGGTAAGSLNLLPSNTRDYGTTSVGFAANQTSVNQVLVGPGRDGAVALLNRGAAVSVLVEILGWVTSPADPTGTGSFYTSTSRTRLVNTTSLAPGHPLSFQVRGQGGAPSGTAVAPATSALLQVTVSSPSAAGSVSLFPSSSATGPAEIRFIQGKTASGLIVAPLALDGSESIAISGATANFARSPPIIAKIICNNAMCSPARSGWPRNCRWPNSCHVARPISGPTAASSISRFSPACQTG